jgi:hypothetical protein
LSEGEYERCRDEKKPWGKEKPGQGGGCEELTATYKDREASAQGRDGTKMRAVVEWTPTNAERVNEEENLGRRYMLLPKSAKTRPRPGKGAFV